MKARRDLIAMYPAYAGPWLDELALLEAGEPIEVAAWEVATFLALPLHQYEPGLRFRIEPDDTLTPI